MKKIKEFFLFLWILIALMLYPIISFHWFRFCRATKDPEAWKFALYGFVGAVGIVGIVTSYLTEQFSLVNGFLFFGGMFIYLLIGELQFKLFMKKKKQLRLIIT